MFFKRLDKVSHVYLTSIISKLQSKRNTRGNFSKKDSKDRVVKKQRYKKVIHLILFIFANQPKNEKDGNSK